MFDIFSKRKLNGIFNICSHRHEQQTWKFKYKINYRNSEKSDSFPIKLVCSKNFFSVHCWILYFPGQSTMTASSTMIDTFSSFGSTLSTESGDGPQTIFPVFITISTLSYYLATVSIFIASSVMDSSGKPSSYSSPIGDTSSPLDITTVKSYTESNTNGIFTSLESSTQTLPFTIGTSYKPPLPFKTSGTLILPFLQKL